MTKRESLKLVNKKIDDIGKKGFIGLGVSLLSLIFALPKGESILDQEINIQIVASIISVVSFVYFLYWVYLEIRKIYFEKTMKFKVNITGESFGKNAAMIKIENKEPVKLQDVHIEMARFSWNKQVWNDIDKFTVGNRFFSSGFSVDRSVSKSPVFVKIAEGIKNPNITHILLDNSNLLHAFR